MAFTQYTLAMSTEQARGIFNTYAYETTDTMGDTSASGYFSQARFSPGGANEDPDWLGSFITVKASDGIYTGEITDSGTVTPNPVNGGGSTYGALTNAQILAIASPSDLENAFSTDDNIIYTFFSGSWYSTGGGVLV